jgi:hypothetical protein
MSGYYTGTIRKLDMDDRTVTLRLNCDEAAMRMLTRAMFAELAVDLAAPNLDAPPATSTDQEK